ncbi:MAG: flagellar biosynthesis protein FlhF [Candidatus Latescibacteria bacterium]|nr:flagellar biosynthesis protein FlhF [Candidatus Latescibacterota bacterium]
MKIRKYVARSMPEALQQVREDLGEHAVILNTRQIRKNTRFNPQGEARVEVTAALDEAGAAAPAPAPAAAVPLDWSYAPPSLRGASLAPAPAEVPALPAARALAPASPPAAAPAPPARGPFEGSEQILRQLRQLQDSVERLERRAPAALVFPKTLGRLVDRLRSTGLVEDLVHRIAQQLFLEQSGVSPEREDREALNQRAAALLAATLPPCRDIRIGRGRKVVGFVGASGAGKTTAAAKIAAGFAMRRKQGIVLISTDDRRVGALDQTRIFAQLIGVELEVAYREEDLRAALDRHPDARLVLIDTAGCGPHERREWEKRRQLLETAGADEVQLVIDTMNGYEHMLDLLEASQALPERRLLFTKLDEAVRPGALLSAAAKSQLPTSYFSVGPSVPGAIEAGDLRKLAARVTGAAAEKGK